MPSHKPFRVGDTVFHKMFGEGRIVWTDPIQGKSTVDFGGNERPLLNFSLFFTQEEAAAFQPGRNTAPHQGSWGRSSAPSVLPQPFNAADLANEPMPVRSFLDARELIPWAGVTLIFGDGATGKSLLLLQLLCGVAVTGSWLGKDVKCGPAIYFSAEDPKEETHIRLGSIARHAGFSFRDLGNLSIHFMAGEECVLGTVDKRTGTVQPTPLFEAFKRQAIATKPALIGIDNLIDVFAGNVIDPAQAKQFMHMMTRLSLECGCPVIILAHPSKSGMSAGDGDGGTRAWSNSSRARLYLQRVQTLEGTSVIEDDPDLRVLTNRKANYGKQGAEIRMRWEDGRFVALDEQRQETGDPSSQAMKAERVFLHLLRWHERHNKFVSPNKSVSYAPTVFAEHKQSEGVKARQFQIAMNDLLDQGKIEIFTHGSPSSRRQHIGFPIGSEMADE